MAVHANIKRIARRQQGETLAFTINNGEVSSDPDNYLVWLDQVPSTGVSFYLQGLKVLSADGDQIPNPLRIDWKLYVSGSCIIDDEPIFEGSTWWESDNERSGRLVQVTNCDARAWFLRLQLEDPGLPVVLQGAIEYFCPGDGGIIECGTAKVQLPTQNPLVNAPVISTGSFIG